MLRQTLPRSTRCSRTRCAWERQTCCLLRGVPVTLRVSGALSHSTGAPLTAESTRNLLLSLMTQTQYQELQRVKSVDFCFSREGIGRFRANVHYQRGTVAGSVRLLPDKMPTLEIAASATWAAASG